MELRLLGDITAWHDGRHVELGHTRQRSVLAVLAVDAGRPVLLDRLIDRVWGVAAPPGVRTTLYGYVHQLRRLLTPTGAAITRRSGGYALVSDPAAVDLHRFTDLVAAARGESDDHRAVRLFDEALDLWRGEACAGANSPWFTSLRVGLARQRLAAELDRNDIALRQGRHQELVADLSALADAHPLDERVAAQFMLAAYRSGRQADALTCYDRILKRLAEELGADPGPRLRHLHDRMLHADPALTADAQVTDAVPAAARGSDREAVRPGPVPRQLPASPPLFTGRVEELARLDQVLDDQARSGGTVVISAIDGAGGIGKTWLALRWAHHNAERFPDGQLHADLHGFDPTGEPTPPSVVLRGFLDALGVAPELVPVDQDARAALYRSLVADRQLLVLLDNAADSAQVVPLLPGGSSCAVLVTSRRRLTGLTTHHGARALELDVLDEATARELLTRHLGHARLAAEPDAATRVLRHCAGLPLAIGIAAARATAQPRLPLAALADELDDDASRLDALDAGELTTNLRLVLSLSLRALSDAATTLLGLLGLAPGPDISLPAAASAAGLPVPRTRALLAELENAHLVRQHVAGRYRMHDLVRLHAAELGARDPDRDAAMLRLVDHYLHSAYAAERQVHPQRPSIALAPPAEGCRPEQVDGRPRAWAWLAEEHANLLATQRPAVDLKPEAVWQLAWCLDNFHALRGHVQDAVAVWELGLAAAERLGDEAVLLTAHRLLGRARAVAGPLDEALRHLEQAWGLAERSGDLVTQGRLQLTLALAWQLAGDEARALPHAVRALELYLEVGEPVWLVEAHSAVGLNHYRLGDHERAREHCAAAVLLAGEHGVGRDLACALRTLGWIAHDTGDHAEALRRYRRALEVYREHGNTYHEVETLESVGHAHLAMGRPDLARAAQEQALHLCRALHLIADAARIEAELAGPRSTQEIPEAGRAE